MNQYRLLDINSMYYPLELDDLFEKIKSIEVGTEIIFKIRYGKCYWNAYTE